MNYEKEIRRLIRINSLVETADGVLTSMPSNQEEREMHYEHNVYIK